MDENSCNVGFDPYETPSNNGTDDTTIDSGDYRQPAAYGVKEDSSVLTNISTMSEHLNDELHRTQQNDLGIQVHNSVDVHKCTSSTCLICSEELGPKFVRTNDLKPVQKDGGLESVHTQKKKQGKEIGTEIHTYIQQHSAGSNTSTTYTLLPYESGDSQITSGELNTEEMENIHKEVEVASRPYHIPDTIDI